MNPEEMHLKAETWFEVSRVVDVSARHPYILIISSYGRMRKIFTDIGKYKDISDGGSVSTNSEILGEV